MTPPDCCPKRPLARVSVTPPSQVEPVIEALAQLSQVQNARASSHELNGKGQAVQSAAQLAERRIVRRHDPAACACSLYEER